MATIAATSMQVAGKRTVTSTTMTSSDTFTYKAGQGQILILRNGTAGTLTPIIDCASVDVSACYAVGSIAAGAQVAIPLDTIRAYLTGVITITGGTGLSASLLEF